MERSTAERIRSFLDQKGLGTKFRRTLTGAGAAVVFGTTYALILPAITASRTYPTLSAEAVSAWAGDDLSVTMHAEVPEGEAERIYVLNAKGLSAGLSEDYEFDENGIAEIEDSLGNPIELHRVVSGFGADDVNYWYMLPAGSVTDITFKLSDDIDVDSVIAASGIMDREIKARSAAEAEEIAAEELQEEIPAAEAPVQTETGPGLQPEIGPGVQPETGPGVQPEIGPGVQPEIGPGVSTPSDAQFYDYEDDDSDSTSVSPEPYYPAPTASPSDAYGPAYDNGPADNGGAAQGSAPANAGGPGMVVSRASNSNAEYIPAEMVEDSDGDDDTSSSKNSKEVKITDGGVINDVSGNVSENDGDEEALPSEVSASLVLSAGSGDSLESAVRDAGRGADKREGAQLTLTWRKMTEYAEELEYVGEDYVVSLYFDQYAKIPEYAYLDAKEFAPGTSEYAALYANAEAAVNEAVSAEAAANGETGANAELASARFFDVKILDDTGEVRPETPVFVRITYDEAVGSEKAAANGEAPDVRAVQFESGSNAKLLSTETAGDGVSVEGVGFQAETLTASDVVGTVVVEIPTDEPFDYTGTTGNVDVHVTAEAGVFPAGSVMTVRDLSEEEYDEAKAAVEEKLEGGVSRMTAVDISFYDASGNEIQPGSAVNVTIKAAAVAEYTDPVVMHVDDDGVANKLETVSLDTGSSEIEVLSPSFSVYAVVEEGTGGDDARATVNFYGKDTETPKVTVYVKNSDTAESIAEIVYDPGYGTLDEGETFRGWSITDGADYTSETTPMTIEEVRTYLEELGIEEGMVVDVYAMIFRTYNIVFKDEDNITIDSDTLVNKAGEAATYTIGTNYTPKTQDQDFQGWNVTIGSDAVEATDGVTTAPYPVGTEVRITGDVTFTVYAPSGYWLSFQENGSGASYTPPQFIQTDNADSVTVEPEAPTRQGYTFGGWYENAECTGDPFTFGGTITQRTNLYAKWTPVEQANYTIIVWKERMSDTYAENGGTLDDLEKNYDFAQSYTLYGTVGDTIGAVTQNNNSVVTDGDGNATQYPNARISGTTKEGTTVNETVSFTGYHCDWVSTDQDVEIKPEGSSVVNVYYDRNVVTYTFYTIGGGYVLGYWEQGGPGGGHYTEYTGTIYIVGDDGYEAYTGTPEYGDGNTYYRQYTTGGGCGGQTIEYAQLTWYEADGNTWTVYQNSIGLYGEALDWPTDTSIWWYEEHNNTQGTGTRMTFKADFLPLDDDMTVEYWGTEHTGNIPIRFYTQNTSGGTSGNDYTLSQLVYASGGTFSINDKFTGFYAYQYRVNGGTWQNVGTLNPSTGIYGTGIDYSTSLDIRFNRITGTITFMDGAYYNGNGVRQDEIVKPDAFNTSESYYFEESVAAWNEDGSKYYVPDAYHTGYTFAGWYADDACTQPYEFTTMQVGGITVYAKWVQTQYRVFLHPNVPTTDTSLEWAQTDQAMNFRVTYGDKVSGGSTIMGERNDYELIGWYTDEGLTNSFNFDAFVLNDTTVTTEYDKTVDMTDPMDKYGVLGADPYNSDYRGNRIWITKKLDLYAKWRSILNGAKGIQVVYEANETTDTGTVAGTGAPTDDLLYLDSSYAVAGNGSAPTDTTLQFLYWIVQRWDDTENAYVNTDVKVYAGDAFEVLKANARVTDNPEWTGEGDTEHDQYIYTVQLMAHYGPKEAETPTHITWYANYEGGDSKTDNDLQINEAVVIEPATLFARTGYEFLGWARVPTTDESGNPIEDYSLSPRDLTEDDLFLKYEDGVFKAEIDGTWKTVTKVAADEVYPYHDLYAVWQVKKYPVNITKVVSGFETDKNIPFEFTETGLTTDGSTFSLVGNENGATVEGVTYSNTENYTEIGYGTTFSVTETADTNFMTVVTYTVTDDEGTVSDETVIANGDELTVTGTMDIVFTNTRRTQSVRVLKTNGTDPLPGAVFSVVVDETEYTLTSGEDGYLAGEGYESGIAVLPLGEYIITETDPPTGFTGPDEPIKITVTATGVTAYGQSGTPAYEVTDPTEEAPYYVVTVPNNPGYALPSTGGSGTYLYRLLGLMLSVACAVLFTRRRALSRAS